MRYLETRVYKIIRPFKKPEYFSDPVKVVLYKDEILFFGDFPDKKVNGLGFKCEYHFKPPLANYPNNANFRVIVDDESRSFEVYGNFDANDIFDMKMVTERYWIAQPEIQKNIIIPLISGWLGGTISWIILQLTK